MAYYLSVSNPYEDSIGTPILDDPGANPLVSMEYADPEYVHWSAAQPGVVQMKQGYPVKPETAPKKILWESTKYGLPDVISNQQVIVACDRFRELVEKFEPNMHQFIPVDVYKPESNIPIARYYWFVVCQRIDSVDRDHTTYKWKLDYTGKDGFWTDRDVRDAKVVFSSRKIGDNHIWMDPHLLVMNSGLCSSAFGKAALAAHFSGLNVTLRDEV